MVEIYASRIDEHINDKIYCEFLSHITDEKRAKIKKFESVN